MPTAHENTEDRRVFARIVADLVRSFGKQHKDIAAAIGLDQSTFSKNLSGEVKVNPESLRNLKDYAKVLRNERASLDRRWSVFQEPVDKDAKFSMACHFAKAIFLKAENYVADILVAPGTTTKCVVEQTLAAISEPGTGTTAISESGREESTQHYNLTWFTPSTLVSDYLRDWSGQNQHLRRAAQLFVYPGLVDEELESFCGPEAEEFAENIKTRFSLAILSGHRFDVKDGMVCFHFPQEKRLQTACALSWATRKYLFLAPTKFRQEGQPAYSIRDLLNTSCEVTIYTTWDNNGEDLQASFKYLADELIAQNPTSTAASDKRGLQRKCLRLIVVKSDADAAVDKREGYLRTESSSSAATSGSRSHRASASGG